MCHVSFEWNSRVSVGDFTLYLLRLDWDNWESIIVPMALLAGSIFNNITSAHKHTSPTQNPNKKIQKLMDWLKKKEEEEKWQQQKTREEKKIVSASRFFIIANFSNLHLWIESTIEKKNWISHRQLHRSHIHSVYYTQPLSSGIRQRYFCVFDDYTLWENTFLIYLIKIIFTTFVRDEYEM